MMWVDKNRHMLARLAASLSALSVLLAVISRFMSTTIVVSTAAYMSFAIVAILFAIYFRIGGLADDKKN
ncbi:MAG: hypothetical protein AABZ77_05300 [Chloroflexota bacterium]